MRDKGRLFSYAVYQKVKRLSNLGWSNKEISDKIELQETLVKKILTLKYSELQKIINANDQEQPKVESQNISFRDNQIIELRENGLTLDEIGKIVDLTRERVRQILRDIAPNLDSGKIRNQVKLQKSATLKYELDSINQKICNNWDEYKTLKIKQLATVLDISDWKLRRSLSTIQYLYLKANEEKNSQIWSDDQCLNALKVAATYSFPLTVLKYRNLLEVGEIVGPTPAIIWKRFGSWVAACELAGIEYGDSLREYNRTWSNVELLTFVRTFMHGRLDGKWSIENYEEWRKLPEIDGPSIGLLRLRLGGWSEIRIQALELVVDNLDMDYFAEFRQHDE